MEDIRALPRAISDHRVLVIFDDLRRPMPLAIEDTGRASILITTRNPRLRLGELITLHEQVLPKQATVEGDERLMWEALSACNPSAAPTDLAARIAGFTSGEANALHTLLAARIVDRLDSHRVRVNYPANVGHAVRAKHAQTVSEMLPHYLGEMPSALSWACEHDWRSAVQLGQRAADVLREHHRISEAAQVLQRLLAEAERRDDHRFAQHVRWELSWLQDTGDQIRPPILAAEDSQLSFAF